ncbi:P-loop containing nucleoside triphosphate hydrolase protein [Zychaea mexicana]|uniref:P-loop containing nucleoside triphosphate hydrolase protein n=1 Tax=Zychaea mexicana TaxID=64656 RepID=UPI0022FE44A1|nr:P-loop containing nucleoside triphosphate hydrolase protein [Zychaea mexicana]KAI9496610.1 P-loop containing nucleoside triphosphate hydrolase protein [Zychaea mexicana]
MAPLQIIGAGFGRTGTDSLRNALNQLGYSTHHMYAMAHGGDERYPEVFQEAYEHPERDYDWEKVYDGFDAAVDWPTAAVVEPLLKKYPNAKIILTVRDPDDWYRSVKNTIFRMSQKGFSAESAPPGIDLAYYKRLVSMIHTLVLDGAFGNPEKFLDEEAMKAKFVAHNKWVQEHIPADQLLVMQLGEGWDRLCQFLGKSVPDTPYPNTNSSKDINKMAKELFEDVNPKGEDVKA